MNPTSRRKITTLDVVVAFYNEEEVLEAFYQALCQELDKLDLSYFLIFVDDGSRDKTLRLLNALADRDPRVSVLSLARNWGHQIALTAGLDYATADAVVVMDGDLQHPPHVIPQMIEKYEAGAEIVYAARLKMENLSFFKRKTSDLYYALLERTTNFPVVRGAADFRLMSRSVTLALQDMQELHRYMRGMVAWTGMPYEVIYYEQPERFAGTPSYTWRKSMKLAKDGFFSFSVLPLNIISGLGVIFTLFALAYLVVVLVIVAMGKAIPGWASSVGVTLVEITFEFIAISILAQYVGMIFEQVKARPLYVLKQKRLRATADTPNKPGAA